MNPREGKPQLGICSPAAKVLVGHHAGTAALRVLTTWSGGSIGVSVLTGLRSWQPSEAFLTDCVAAGRRGQVWGEEHPQGPGWAAGQAQGGGVLTNPVSHHPHQKLVGPGDAKGWRKALIPGPETQNECCHL